MSLNRRLWILLLLWLSLCNIDSAFSASFDCEKAHTRIEKMICADPELSDLDRNLGNYYYAAKEEFVRAGAATCLKTDQLRWLKLTRNECQDNTCLRTVYLNRLSELDALQPGVTAINYIDLPAQPSLAWIIPPALDRVAAPLNKNAKPMEAVGTLIGEMTDNGFVLRTKAGTDILLAMLMFLDGETPVMLKRLASEKETFFLARGHADENKNGKFFEPSQCVFIYRMPNQNRIKLGPNKTKAKSTTPNPLL